jgi:hypothetical protein
MSRQDPGRPEPAREPPERDTPTYQGSRFPWWLAVLYLAFVVWGFAYLALYYLPDLRAWLLP